METSLHPILVLYPRKDPGCLFLFPSVSELGRILEQDCMKSPALTHFKKLMASSDPLEEARSHPRPFLASFREHISEICHRMSNALARLLALMKFLRDHSACGIFAVSR